MLRDMRTDRETDRQTDILITVLVWRFSAVVASFVVRTKLLNVKPG